MFHRFKSAVAVAQYINDEILSVLTFADPIPAASASEQAVFNIIASIEAQTMLDTYGIEAFENLVLEGYEPLDVNKWIKGLYVDFDNIEPEDQAEYLEEYGNPNDELYQAISKYYTQFGPAADSVWKLEHLKDPVVIPGKVVSKLHQLLKTNCGGFASVVFYDDYVGQTHGGQGCIAISGPERDVQQVIAYTVMALNNEAFDTIMDSLDLTDQNLAAPSARGKARIASNNMMFTLLTKSKKDYRSDGTIIYWPTLDLE